MSSPVVTHPVCDLNMRERLRQARVDAVARSVGRANGRRSLLARLFRHDPPKQRVPAADDQAFRHAGEDVWRALRF